MISVNALNKRITSYELDKCRLKFNDQKRNQAKGNYGYTSDENATTEMYHCIERRKHNASDQTSESPRHRTPNVKISNLK